MKQAKHWVRASVLLALPLAACSTLVGADFDDLGPLEAGGTSAGSITGGSGGAGGLDKVPGGGAGSSSGGGAGLAGAPSAGADSGGAGGEPAGGAPPEGGAAPGGAGNGGESGGGGEGGEPPVVVLPTAVVINELKGQGSGDDYIELYNPGTEAADLAGSYVADDSNNRFTFPAGATIAPDGYVVVRMQPTGTSTGMVTTCFGFTPCYVTIGWGISASGEVISLRDAQGLLLDELTYPDEGGPGNVGNGNALGRIPDGAETTGPIDTSPGATNVAAP